MGGANLATVLFGLSLKSTTPLADRRHGSSEAANQNLEPTMLRGTSQTRSLTSPFEAFFDVSPSNNSASSAYAPTEPPTAFADKISTLSNTPLPSSISSTSDTKASFHYLEWTYTGLSLGCQWGTQPLILRCSNGGRIHVDHPCLVEGLNTAVCTNPYEEAGDFDRESQFLSVWCAGTDEDELNLSARLPSSELSCSDGGEVGHGIALGRACGALGTDDFSMRVDESFCDNPDEYIEPLSTEENPICMGLIECDSGTCDVPHVGAESSKLDDSCVYAVES
jgi:hypothetical protein